MPKIYLTTPYLERMEAKDLGARWDGSLSKWYVPDGCDLTRFSKWLPPGTAPTSTSTVVAPIQTGNTSLAVASKKGVSLSSLLAGVSHAVAQAYKSGVWTIVEVVELRTVNGHVYIGVSERDARGIVLAKTNAVIWQSTANSILPEFERATGAQLAPGMNYNNAKQLRRQATKFENMGMWPVLHESYRRASHGLVHSPSASSHLKTPQFFTLPVKWQASEPSMGKATLPKDQSTKSPAMARQPL